MSEKLPITPGQHVRITSNEHGLKGAEGVVAHAYYRKQDVYSIRFSPDVAKRYNLRLAPDNYAHWLATREEIEPINKTLYSL